MTHEIKSGKLLKLPWGSGTSGKPVKVVLHPHKLVIDDEVVVFSSCDLIVCQSLDHLEIYVIDIRAKGKRFRLKPVDDSEFSSWYNDLMLTSKSTEVFTKVFQLNLKHEPVLYFVTFRDHKRKFYLLVSQSLLCLYTIIKKRYRENLTIKLRDVTDLSTNGDQLTIRTPETELSIKPTLGTALMLYDRLLKLSISRPKTPRSRSGTPRAYQLDNINTMDSVSQQAQENSCSETRVSLVIKQYNSNNESMYSNYQSEQQPATISNGTRTFSKKKSPNFLLPLSRKRFGSLRSKPQHSSCPSFEHSEPLQSKHRSVPILDTTPMKGTWSRRNFSKAVNEPENPIPLRTKELNKGSTSPRDDQDQEPLQMAQMLAMEKELSLTQEDWTLLMEHSSLKVYDPGQFIQAEFITSRNQLTKICQGNVKFQGGSYTYFSLGINELYGISSALPQLPFPVAIVADSSVQARQVEQVVLQELLENNDILKTKFYKFVAVMLASRLSQFYSSTAALASKLLYLKTSKLIPELPTTTKSIQKFRKRFNIQGLDENLFLETKASLKKANKKVPGRLYLSTNYLAWISNDAHEKTLLKYDTLKSVSKSGKNCLVVIDLSSRMYELSIDSSTLREKISSKIDSLTNQRITMLQTPRLSARDVHSQGISNIFHFSSQDWNKVFKNGKLFHYERGVQIRQQFDDRPFLGLVLCGRAFLFKDQNVVGHLQKHDLFGVEAFLVGAAPAQIIAATPVDVVVAEDLFIAKQLHDDRVWCSRFYHNLATIVAHKNTNILRLERAFVQDFQLDSAALFEAEACLMSGKSSRQVRLLVSSVYLRLFPLNTTESSIPIEELSVFSIASVKLAEVETASKNVACSIYVGVKDKPLILTFESNSLAHTVITFLNGLNRFYSSAGFLGQGEAVDWLHSEYFEGYEGGQILSSESQDWEYHPDGTLHCIEGRLKGVSYSWNGSKLRVCKGDDLGTGFWDGFSLSWKLPSAKQPLFVYTYNQVKKEYQHEASSDIWKWTRHFLASMSQQGHWTVEGDVPKPVVMLLQMLHVSCGTCSSP